MANARFFRASLFGGFVTGSEWAAEQWQFGLSLVANTDGSPIDRAAIKAPMPTCEVLPTAEVQTSGVWDSNFGFTGIAGQQMQLGQQIVIANNLKAFWDSVKAYVTQDQQMEGVKITAYERGLDGKPKVINGSSYLYLKAPAAGTKTTFPLPPQCCSVVSFRTGARGPGGRGRMYLPCTGAVLSTEGTLGSTEINALLTATQSLGSAISATGAQMVVANQSQFTFSSITQYGVGNHVDTQRRRATGVDEAYTYVNALA